MASSARIEELQKKFDENPRRYFAPLANEYRKAGDPDQAIAICREFLPQQPGHMSGHIVYGQALFDAQQFEEARTVFDTALTLDPENLIALRHLGDIARTLGEIDTARAWYQRVLDADPRNEDIAAILTTLAAAPAAAEPPPAEPPPVEPPPIEPPPVAETGPSGTVVIHAISVSAPAPAEEPPPPAPPEFVSGFEMPQGAVEPPPAEPPPPEPPPAPSAPPADELLDLDELQIQPETPVVPRISTPRASLRSMGLEIERAGDDSLVFDEEVASPPPEIEGEAPSPVEFESAFTMEAFEMPAAPAAPAPPAPAVPESSAAPAPIADPFATETMAELYLSQGHAADALGVYRQLLTQRPGDAGLQGRVAELEARLAQPAPAAVAAEPQQSIPELEPMAPEPEPAAEAPAPVLAEPTPEPEPEPEPEPAVAAAAAGPTIREFLAGLAARGPAMGATPASGELAVEEVSAVAVVEEWAVPEAEPQPELPAAAAEPVDAAGAVTPSTDADIFRAEAAPSGAVATGGSIDALFGAGNVSIKDQEAATTLAGAFGSVEEEAASSSATPTTPMAGAPARRATEELSLDSVFRGPTSGGASQPAGFSFDRFFSSGTPAQASPATEGPASGPGSDAPDDDIEQFNSWLDGLKKR
jgi:tetratricopeptide (TPR) repeat protein